MTDLRELAAPPADLAVVHDLTAVRRPVPASAGPRAHRLARLADRQAEDTGRTVRLQVLERLGRRGG